MDKMPDTEVVIQAINSLYHNPEITNKEKASKWLGSLQESVFAWKISDDLLLKKHDMESLYFAAQTMRTKIQYSFHELPDSSYISLRDSLVHHISNLGDTENSVILTQLSLALSDLALQVPSWKCLAKDLIDRFVSDPNNMPALLEVLIVLPEEINNRPLRLGENRRTELTEDLCSSFPYVFAFLNDFSEKTVGSERMLSKVFRCLASWLGLSQVQSNLVAESKLLYLHFEKLTNIDSCSFLHEAATDSVCSSLLLIEVMMYGIGINYFSAVIACVGKYSETVFRNKHENLDQHLALAKSMIQGVFMLPNAYQTSIEVEENDKIFTELAESLLYQIAETPGRDFGDLRILDLLLACVDHPDYEIAEVTFNFWYRLSEVLYQKNDSNLNAIFCSYTERLITSLCYHCNLDPDKDGIPDDNDEFTDFRNKVSELIKDVVFIVGSKNCFQQMFENLKKQTTNSSWENAEASLYVMTAVAKIILPDENEVVPSIVDAVLQLHNSNTHIAVKYTSTRLLGELCEWIDFHPAYLDVDQENSQLIKTMKDAAKKANPTCSQSPNKFSATTLALMNQPILNFLLKCLQDHNLATVSATALQSICSACRDHMKTHFSGLLQIIQVLDSFSISTEAAVGLLVGTTVILSKLPLENVSAGMKQLCLLQVSVLVEILKTDEQVKIGSKTDPVIWLDRLSAIFRHTNPIVSEGEMHPGQAVIEEIWPVLSSVCTKYQSDIRIIERCCRCIRFAIRCIGKQSAPLLQPLVQQIVELYQLHQHSCFLYLGSILVDEYGTEPGCIRGLIDMLTAFSTPTFKLLEGENGLKNHPDTVDDLFRLCNRFVQRATIPFLQSTVVESIVNCGLVACSLEHKDANASVMKFFHDLVKRGRVNEEKDDFKLRSTHVKELLKIHGQTLVNNLIQAPLFCLPTFMIPDIADVIMELMLLDRPTLCCWLEVSLRTLPIQRSGDCVTATAKQLLDFHKTITRAENTKSVSTALRELCRLFR
ncbi:Transportin-3 [Nymphon striatum]|nr:Transportin-3 [Nymphon striatum]